MKEIQSIHILSCQYYYQLALYIRQAVMIMRGRVWFIHHDLSTNQNESDIRYRIMRIIRIWVDILMFYEGSCLNDAFLIYHILFLCQSSIYFCSLWSINADILCSFAFGEVRKWTASFSDSVIIGRFAFLIKPYNHRYYKVDWWHGNNITQHQKQQRLILYWIDKLTELQKLRINNKYYRDKSGTLLRNTHPPWDSTTHLHKLTALCVLISITL